jgi:hypothetical protein
MKANPINLGGRQFWDLQIQMKTCKITVKILATICVENHEWRKGGNPSFPK